MDSLSKITYHGLCINTRQYYNCISNMSLLKIAVGEIAMMLASEKPTLIVANKRSQYRNSKLESHRMSSRGDTFWSLEKID